MNPAAYFANQSKFNEIEIDDDGIYRITVEASQWQYRFYDMSKITIDIWSVNNLNRDEVKEFRKNNEIIGDLKFPKGVTVEFILRSRDVTHGVEIEELDFTLLSEKANYGEVWSKPVIAKISFPNENLLMKAATPIFVGLGTDDMEFTILIGDLHKANSNYIPLSFVFGVFILFSIYFFKKLLFD